MLLYSASLQPEKAETCENLKFWKLISNRLQYTPFPDTDLLTVPYHRLQLWFHVGPNRRGLLSMNSNCAAMFLSLSALFSSVSLR